MIKKLKIKFISTIISIISLLIIIILIAINLIMSINMEKRIINSMRELAITNGMKPPNFKPLDFKQKHGNLILNFIIKLDDNNNIIETIYPKNIDISDYNLQEILNKILPNIDENNNKLFKYNNLAYFSMNKSYGEIIVFEDITNFNQNKQNLIYISILVYLVSFIILFIISYFLTEWIIKPVKENFDMQKQFIANASHELKTPLTIISTNLSILKDEIFNEDQEFWLENIKDEIFNMNKLINQLLFLSKSENINEINKKIQLNLTNTITNIIFQYETICFEEKKIFKYNIKEDIYLNCNKEDIITIVRILLDNAIKYTKENDIIEVTLDKFKNKSYLTIFNTGIGIENKFKDKIFERFFRVDLSRNKEIEGYGLGLAIAKNIIDNNKWKIFVESEYTKWIKFTIEF